VTRVVALLRYRRSVIRLLISLGLQLLGNAVGLLVAAGVLDGMTLSATAFLLAVVIFTAVVAIGQPFLTQVSQTHVPALRGSVALVATFIGLLVTSLVSDGLQIDGAGTWVLATLIVWVVALLAAIVLPLIFLKKAVASRSDRRQSR
jgi:putative membrane protein